jgi:hypothetical protein
MTLYQITMYTCSDEWITGKKTMSLDEAVEAGLLSPSQVKGSLTNNAAPGRMDNPPPAIVYPARASMSSPAWKRAAARLLGVR